MKPTRLAKGFTLIELMLVVAIIGLLAAIALPKFANLVVKAKEASVKGKLGSLRSALSIYYADNEGFYPIAGIGLPTIFTTGGKYLNAIPAASIPTVPAHDSVNAFGTNLADSLFGSVWGPNAQAWNMGFNTGHIYVNCTHTDSKGSTWSLW